MKIEHPLALKHCPFHGHTCLLEKCALYLEEKKDCALRILGLDKDKPKKGKTE